MLRDRTQVLKGKALRHPAGGGVGYTSQIPYSFEALLVNKVELFPGPVAGEIAVLTEHFLLVVHFLGEVKEGHGNGSDLGSVQR